MSDTQDATNLPRSKESWRKWLWPLLKWSLTLAVIAFVGKYAWELWNRDADAIGKIQLRIGWLLPAGIAYAIGWLPSVWFWRRMLHAVGHDVKFTDAGRAYFCGHLGKYIPGKAMVLVIRAALLKDRGAHPAVAALTATYETLLMMGAGAAIAIALSPMLLTDQLIDAFPDTISSLFESGWVVWITTIPYLPPLIVIVLIALALQPISRMTTIVAARMTPPEIHESGRQVKIGRKLIAAGLCAGVVGWTIHGLSLGLTLQAVSPGSLNLADWPIWTAGISIAIVIGFATLIVPGGVGVREGLLIAVLGSRPSIGPQQAVAAALLLRVVFLVTEITLATALYYMVRPTNGPSELGEKVS